MHIKSSLLLILCFAGLSPLSAVHSGSTANLKFPTYTVKDGLLTNSVNIIFQDKRGLLWLGTQDGVNLFDGREFTEIGENTNLSSGYVYDIKEDMDGNILIGCSFGLYLYDIARDLLTPFHEELMDYEVLKVVSVAKDDVLVVLKGLGLFEFKEGQLTPLLPDITVNDLAMPGRLAYIATNHGLIIYNPEENRSETISPELNFNSLTYHRQTLYAGTTDGVLTLNTMNGTTGFVKTAFAVTVLIPGEENSLWMGSASRGLFLKNTDSGGIRNFDDSGTVLSMFLDSSDNLWIGYLGRGLKKVDIHRIGFSYLGPENGLDNTIIVSLWEDADESLWIGTFGGGLYHFSPEGEPLEHLASHPESAGSPGDNRIMSLFRDSRGILWMGTKSAGIYSFRNGQFSHVAGSNSSVYTIGEDKYGRIWAVTQGGGVHILSPDGHIEKTLKAPVLPTLNFRTMLIRDDTVYLGSMDNGLILLDLEGKLLRHYSAESDAKGLNGSHILSIYVSEEGTLWVGTAGGGLHRYVPQTDSFRSITIRDGLPNNTVYGILEDARHRLWISTNKGLALVHPETLKIVTYSEADGLQSNEFNSGAALKGADTFYMGGVNGLTFFDPGSLTGNDTAPVTLLTNLSINNKNIHVGDSLRQRTVLPRAISLMDELELTRDDLVVTFDFRSLHYSSPEDNTYAYYLEGLESDWNYTGSSLHSTYTNLSPGSYRFWYKSASAYGVWSPDKSLRVIVKPEFYEYLIFKIGMAILLLSVILFTVLFLIKRAEEKNIILEKRVIERTRELENALNREKKMRGILSVGEKMSSLVSLTVRLSHNLNTPLGSSLTAISYLKDSLERNGADQTLIDCCNMALDGTNQAVKIVRQLSSASSAQALPTPVMFNLSDVIREYISRSWIQALERSDIKCALYIPDTDRYLLGSISALQESLDSLIRNSLHHGFQGKDSSYDEKKISIRIVYSEKEALIIYRDNGRGIDESIQTKIFEPFEGGTGSGSNGSGMGLFLVYNLIKLQFSGSISCVNDNEGACFHIRLPLLDGKRDRV